jgi:AcrR family transcriptional regulator
VPRSFAPERASAPPAGGENDDGERRDRIAGAAARCFARWGYIRTRMEDIAREAGIARPALYRYYAGKEALLLEVLVRHIEQRAAELHRRVRRRGPSGPLIVEALRTGITGADDAMAQTVLEEDVVHVTAKLVAESHAVFEAMSAYWRPYLEYARERGELRPGVELDEAVRWLTFIIFHFLTMPETVPPVDELPRYLKTFVVNALVES